MRIVFCLSLRFLFPKIEEELVEYLSEPHASVETTTLFEQQYKISLAAIRQLQLAMSEARKMNSKVIGSEHILLALIHDKEQWTVKILKQIKEEYLNFDISIQAIGGFDMPPQMGGVFPPEDEDDSGFGDVFRQSGKESARASETSSKR